MDDDTQGTGPAGAVPPAAVESADRAARRDEESESEIQEESPGQNSDELPQ